MGRLPKKGIDYFSHDTDASTHKTLSILEGEFGNDGYAVWFKLLENLGRTPELFLDLSERTEWKYLVSKFNVSEERAEAIMDTLADIKAIDPELWNDYRIVWIENFVARLADLYKRRRAEIPQRPTPGKQPEPKPAPKPKREKPKPEPEPTAKPQPEPEPQPDPEQYPERQVFTPEEQDEKPDPDDLLALTHEDIMAAQERDERIIYLAKQNGLPTYEANMLSARDMADEYSLEWLEEAIRRTGEGREQTWRYVRGILRQWKEKGHMDTGGLRAAKSKPREKRDPDVNPFADYLGDKK